MEPECENRVIAKEACVDKTEDDDHHLERLNASSLLRSGSILVIGAGLTGLVNALFNLLFVRVTSPSTYSSVGPLLALGTLCASASVGIEYVAISLISQSKSYQPIIRQFLRLVIPSALALFLTPFVSSYLHVSGISAFLGILLGSVTLLAALPLAMLVARGMLIAAVLIGLLEASFRCLALVFAHSIDPVLLGLSVSLGVTVIGGGIMALYALRQSRESTPRSSSKKSGKGQLQKSLLALGLYLPLTLPTWLGRHLLPTETAGIVAFAAFLGSGVMLFAGPVTSALMPRTKAITESATIRHGALLTTGFAALASVLVIAAGPTLFPHLVATPLPHLSASLVPLCLSGTGWAVAAYFSWVGSANGHSTTLLVWAALVSNLTEWVVASAVGTKSAILWSPLLALAIYLAAMCWTWLKRDQQPA